MHPEANDEVHVNTVTLTMAPPTTGPRHIAEEHHTSLSSPDVNETECPRFNKIWTQWLTRSVSHRTFSGSTAQLLQSGASRKLGTATARGRSADKEPLSILFIFLQV